MTITSTFTHKREGDFEEYSFPSSLNLQQRHYIERDGDEPWLLCPVQREEALTLDEVRELLAEIAELFAFMAHLKARELRRNTEPGEPDLAGRGGGL